VTRTPLSRSKGQRSRSEAGHSVAAPLQAAQFVIVVVVVMLTMQHKASGIRTIRYYTTQICIAPSRQANRKRRGWVIASLRVICSGEQFRL